MATTELFAAAADDATALFHPIIERWFRDRIGTPTEPQRRGWRSIASGHHTLIAAPTGSGKTLAAFLWCLDRLFRQGMAGELANETQVVYVSPLKALSNDIHRNLEVPLAEIRAAAIEAGHRAPPIRAAVRTGDTPATERQAMLRHPPHILVTTPESLYLLLTSVRGREMLRGVRTVIVDEIHALARDKRGSHLALSLERLVDLTGVRPTRIGLSATQRPIEDVARFLVGAGPDPENPPACTIVDVGHQRELDLAIEVPPSELAAVCSHECWGEVYERLTQLITTHRSTLIFVNTRRLAERVSHHLIELLGEDAVAGHHGSMSRAMRFSAEERLKTGQLKAIVATASLEMGIDVGYLDLVCQLGSPRSIATFLQRVGRSGHSLGLVPKGRLFPLSRDELLECLAVIRSVRRGRLDAIEIPAAPLDILAQQIVAAVAADEWDESELYALCRRAWPFRELSRENFEAAVELVAQGADPKTGRGAHLHRDRINGRLRARRGARIAAITSGGAIPEVADYRVVTEEDGTFVGTLNEDFAIESQAGDVFQLGNMSWRIRYVRGGEVVVQDAQGAPATVPFWLGEAPGRTRELSAEVAALRSEIASRIEIPPGRPHESSVEGGPPRDDVDLSQAAAWLVAECGADDWAAAQAARYVAAQKAAIPAIPTQRQIVFERFFDESGGSQLVIHAPLGARINRAWGLAMRKRFCRSFDFELQASATDDGVLLSMGPQHSFPVDALFKMLNPQNGQPLLEQALLAAPLFQTRWRWNATRALAILRYRGGKKVPPYLQRHRSDDLLASVFPQTVGCLENHSGDVEIPDHPLVNQTVHDCLHEAMDIDGWLDVLRGIAGGDVELVPADTREPSPFSHQIINANPYAFLDGAPLEERRTRAVSVRRTLDIAAVRDLGWLDPDAIAQVREEARPLVRDADELHDALIAQGVLLEQEGLAWTGLFAELQTAGRATRARIPDRPPLWLATENWPLVAAALPAAEIERKPGLPSSVRQQWESSEALVNLLRGRLQIAGPVTAVRMAHELGLDVGRVEAALMALEAEGMAMRGRYTPPGARARQGDDLFTPQDSQATPPIEWCDRRLLARIHRLTLDRLRRQIEPVEPPVFLRFLAEHQHLTPDHRLTGPAGVREVIRQLQGFEMAAGVWERRILPLRIKDYDPAWLDQLAFSGELTWGRLRPFRPEENGRASRSRLTRAVPLSLVLRNDLPWLLPPDREAATAPVSSNARAVLEALQTRGALFYHDLLAVADLLPTHLDEALLELAQLGMLTADGFAPLRVLATQSRGTRRRRRERQAQHSAGASRLASAGRWSLFPGTMPAIDGDEWLKQWVTQLLRRWGVLFRDLLTREAAAPTWGQLVPVLRRLEARGEIRGGRFVSGVGGEQYAAENSVQRLRSARDSEPATDYLVVAGSDPLNLEGVVTSADRIGAKATNALALRDGHVVASFESGHVQFREALPAEVGAEISRWLRRTG
ncbi:MAG TPA: DEAD/DEAH box helicase [Pirellulales bacterium]|nr:DEAD/DEAH box helicase [Pirellulales bacterium]